MAWTIEFTASAVRQLERLDKSVAQRIRKFLHERVAPLDNPRTLGKALRGETLGEFWKFRVGDYRLITAIEDDRLVVLVIKVGHRREIYR
ncbi:MAG: type II toxin-antitoxin system RelE/ParE family toxin [Candidatus Korobacteraceae bacterium]